MFRLKELRKEKNITQKELSEKLLLGRTSYNQYEKGKIQPPIEILCKIADFYGVSIDYLCKHETNKLIDTSNWTDNRKAVLKTFEQLNETNVIILLGYITHMLYEQQKNSI